MATKTNKLYKTGEMARLFALNKDTLFYYDRIGLFSPKYRKGNTGYRYYDSGQIMLLDAIISLREMDISIPELKKYINNMNTDVFLNLMELESSKIETKIKDFTIKKKTISELTKKITKAKQNDENKLFITEEDKCCYLSEPYVRTSKNDVDNWNNTYMKFWEEIDSSKITTIGAILPKESFLNEDYEHISHIIAYTIEKTNSIREKGLYANLYAKGSYEELNKNYQVFKDAIETEGYIPISDIHEEYVISSLSEKDDKNFVTLLSVMVERKSNPE